MVSAKTGWSKHSESIVRALLLFFLCATLVATLWPFTPYPRNDVSWLKNSNGLRFGGYGSISSSGEFSKMEAGDSPSCTIEVWFEPGLTKDSNTILAFYHLPSLVAFTLRQEGDNLYILRDVPDGRLSLRKAAIWIEHAFVAGKDLHIAVTSGTDGAFVYINGKQVGHSSNFGLTLDSLSGSLIVGNSPLQNNTWNGILRGLAIYDQEFTPPQISTHYAERAKGGHAEDQNSQAIARYAFDERKGNTIHNQAHRGPDLYIPTRYRIVKKGFLTPPWREFHADWAYILDVVVNIIGFLPLGFFLGAYLSLVKRSGHVALKTMALCAVLSLAIETLQGFLPTRSSGLTDVITNTLGGVLGALVYESKLTQSILRKFGMASISTNGSPR
jgi:VanZ like family/Concanavalin A-like lectin/glucanases superfamily